MKIRYSISALLMILLLAACKNGLTIFDQIDQETKLEEAVITGSVNSIVKSGDTLYASDGNIYSKNIKDIRGWSKIAGPEGTIIKLAADENRVYALTGEYDLDTRTYKNKKIFSTFNSQNKWETVETQNIEGEIGTIFWDGNIHSTPIAYLQTQKDNTNKFYKISGNSVSEADSSITSTVLLTRSDVTYTAKDKTITGKSESESDTNRGSVTLPGDVYSLTYSAVDNAIYAGTKEGLKKLPLDASGKLTGESHNPPGNWQATINAYEAFAVLATGTTAEDATLYTSTIQQNSTYAKINGLWGYYYSRRNNWNRE